MKKIINLFTRQNWGIKIGFCTLAISIFFCGLGLILLATANFKAPTGGETIYAGNGFDVISAWGGLSNFLSKSGYSQMDTYYHSNKFLSYPIPQVTVGIIFAVIIASTFICISALSLVFGYFKRWLYS